MREIQPVTLQEILPGRDGWVYLIHAVGTKRYKIGRSNNPLARLEVLKGQSPYPLQVIWSRWTFDAIEDEKRAHQALMEYRVYGEWFEFEEVGTDGRAVSSSLDEAKTVLEYRSVINELINEGFNACCRLLGVDEKTETPLGAMEVYDLYPLASSVSDINKTRYFLLNQLPVIYHQYWCWVETVDANKYIEHQNEFLCASFRTFALISLNKEWRHQ